MKISKTSDDLLSDLLYCQYRCGAKFDIDWIKERNKLNSKFRSRIAKLEADAAELRRMKKGAK